MGRSAQLLLGWTTWNLGGTFPCLPLLSLTIASHAPIWELEATAQKCKSTGYEEHYVAWLLVSITPSRPLMHAECSTNARGARGFCIPVVLGSEYRGEINHRTLNL